EAFHLSSGKAHRRCRRMLRRSTPGKQESSKETLQLLHARTTRPGQSPAAPAPRRLAACGGEISCRHFTTGGESSSQKSMSWSTSCRMKATETASPWIATVSSRELNPMSNTEPLTLIALDESRSQRDASAIAVSSSHDWDTSMGCWPFLRNTALMRIYPN